MTATVVEVADERVVAAPRRRRGRPHRCEDVPGRRRDAPQLDRRGRVHEHGTDPVLGRQGRCARTSGWWCQGRTCARAPHLLPVDDEVVVPSTADVRRLAASEPAFRLADADGVVARSAHHLGHERPALVVVAELVQRQRRDQPSRQAHRHVEARASTPRPRSPARAARAAAPSSSGKGSPYQPSSEKAASSSVGGVRVVVPLLGDLGRHVRDTKSRAEARSSSCSSVRPNSTQPPPSPASGRVVPTRACARLSIGVPERLDYRTDLTNSDLAGWTPDRRSGGCLGWVVHGGRGEGGRLRGAGEGAQDRGSSWRRSCGVRSCAATCGRAMPCLRKRR